MRCHRFLKGEDTLVLAWAGTAPARAAAASGAPVDLPEADRQARRLGRARIAADRRRAPDPSHRPLAVLTGVQADAVLTLG